MIRTILGCPIRKSRDQSFLAAPPGFSQPSTSFIASASLGIHRSPLVASAAWTRLLTTNFQLSLISKISTKSISIYRLNTYLITSTGGDKGSRTPDLLRARQALYQLSYVPSYPTRSLVGTPITLVGLPGLEPGTSPLSGVRSNQLSYSPLKTHI